MSPSESIPSQCSSPVPVFESRPSVRVPSQCSSPVPRFPTPPSRCRGSFVFLMVKKGSPPPARIPFRPRQEFCPRRAASRPVAVDDPGEIPSPRANGPSARTPPLARAAAPSIQPQNPDSSKISFRGIPGPSTARGSGGWSGAAGSPTGLRRETEPHLGGGGAPPRGSPRAHCAPDFRGFRFAERPGHL